MSKITREDIGEQHARLTLVLDVADYETQYNSEIKKIRNKVQLKGFRKGKTPLPFLKKTYGESILADVVFKKVSDELNKYFEDEKLALIGNPIPHDETHKIHLDPVSMQSYTLNYEIGYLPMDFKIEGISKKKSFDVYDVEVPEKWVDDDIERFKKQMGERKEVDEPIMEGDVIRVKGKEMADGAIKDGGVESEFDLFYNSLSESGKKLFDGKKPGAKMNADIYTLENDMKPEMAKKYLLKLEEEDMGKEVNGDFELEVLTVTRVFPVELNAENLEKIFGKEEAVENEDGARVKLREHAKKGFEQGINNLFFTDALDHINEKNEFPVPAEFFKKWLVFEASQKQNVPEPTDEQIENEIKAFRKRTIISKLLEVNDIKVETDMLRANMKSRLARMMGGQPMGDAFYEDMVNKMLNDNQYRDFVDESMNEVAMDSLSKSLKEQFKLNSIAIDFDTFKAKVDELNARFQPPAVENEGAAAEEIEELSSEEV